MSGVVLGILTCYLTSQQHHRIASHRIILYSAAKQLTIVGLFAFTYSSYKAHFLLGRLHLSGMSSCFFEVGSNRLNIDPRRLRGRIEVHPLGDFTISCSMLKPRMIKKTCLRFSIGIFWSKTTFNMNMIPYNCFLNEFTQHAQK